MDGQTSQIYDWPGSENMLPMIGSFIKGSVTHWRKRGNAHIVYCIFPSPIGTACQLGPCIQRGNNVGAASLSLWLKATTASAQLPFLGKLSQHINKSCFSNTTFVTSAQYTKSEDSKRAGLTATRTMCHRHLMESSRRVFNNGHQDSPVESTESTVAKTWARTKSNTSTPRLQQVHQQSITPGRWHQAFDAHNVWVSLSILRF